MSKLATIRQYSMSPAAGGGIFSVLGKVAKGAVGFIKGGIKALTKSKTAQVVAQQLPNAGKAAQYMLPAVAAAGVTALTSGGGGGGASGGWSGRRRGRGITARELRGFRKVSNLLHKEGMVSRRAHRGRSH